MTLRGPHREGREEGVIALNMQDIASRSSDDASETRCKLPIAGFRPTPHSYDVDTSCIFTLRKHATWIGGRYRDSVPTPNEARSNFVDMHFGAARERKVTSCDHQNTHCRPRTLPYAIRISTSHLRTTARLRELAKLAGGTSLS